MKPKTCKNCGHEKLVHGTLMTWEGVQDYMGSCLVNDPKECSCKKFEEDGLIEDGMKFNSKGEYLKKSQDKICVSCGHDEDSHGEFDNGPICYEHDSVGNSCSCKKFEEKKDE